MITVQFQNFNQGQMGEGGGRGKWTRNTLFRAGLVERQDSVFKEQATPDKRRSPV